MMHFSRYQGSSESCVMKDIFSALECLQRKHMPVAHLDRQKTGILAKTGQVFPCE